MTEISGLNQNRYPAHRARTAVPAPGPAPERPTEVVVTPVQPDEGGPPGVLPRAAAVARSTAGRTRTACSPLVLLLRGLRRELRWARLWWSHSGGGQRKAALGGLTATVGGLLFVPYGSLALAGVFLGVTAVYGRGTGPPETLAQLGKLQSIYNGLVPYFHDAHDPAQLFEPGAEFRRALDAWCFDEAGRLIKLELHYSPYFRDGEAEMRAKVENAIERRTGGANDFMYEWNEEHNRLAVAILPHLGGRMATVPGPRPGAPG